MHSFIVQINSIPQEPRLVIYTNSSCYATTFQSSDWKLQGWSSDFSHLDGTKEKHTILQNHLIFLQNEI